MQAELLQQEIINRHRMSVAIQRLVADLPLQAAAAEERMFMAEYVKGYQLVSLATCTAVGLPDKGVTGPTYLHTTFLRRSQVYTFEWQLCWATASKQEQVRTAAIGGSSDKHAIHMLSGCLLRGPCVWMRGAC